jgi:hypothetical protein
MLFFYSNPQKDSGTLLDNYRQFGGKLIRYRSVWSLILITSMQSVVVHVRPDQSKFKAGLRYAGRSLLLGFWGLPVGTVFSLVAVIINCSGGEDVTTELTSPPPLDGKRPLVKSGDKVVIIALGVVITLIVVGIVLMLKYLKV